MNMLKRSLRTTIALAAGAAMLASVSTSALAVDPTVSISAPVAPNVCGITLNSNTYSLPAASWGGSAWNHVNATVSVSGTLTATGTPGNRDCNVSITNTDFLNNNGTGSVKFLDASAITYNNLPLSSFPAATGPIGLSGSPIGPLSFKIEGDPYPVAPDTYTSIVTVTIADAP